MRITHGAVKFIIKEYYNIDIVREGRGSVQEYYRTCRCTFGVTAKEMQSIINHVHEEVKPVDPRLLKFFVGTFHQLRCYPNIVVACRALRTDPKTYRKHIWKYTDDLARLELVCTCYEVKYSSWLYLPTTNPTKLRIQRRLRNVRAGINELESAMMPDDINVLDDAPANDAVPDRVDVPALPSAFDSQSDGDTDSSDSETED